VPEQPAVDQDRFGKVEQAGVGYIPDEQRGSRPLNLFTVFFSGNLAFGVIVFGWLPVTYGLSFVDAVVSSLVGIAIGTLLVAPLGLLGPRTGTSTPVSSGAHFGVTGRLVGSALSLMFALAYAAIAVWISGDALVAVGHRLLGLSDGGAVRAVAYGLISVEIVVVALYGHGTVVAMQRFVLPVVGMTLLVGVFAFASGFRPAPAGTGNYLLGQYWPTWIFAVIMGLGGPLSYAVGMGDYCRRISRRHGDRRILLACAGGLFLGLGLTSVFGSFTATAFNGRAGSYVQNLVDVAPTWYVLPIVLIALAGGLGQGVMTIYSSGLDLTAFIPRLRRVHTTLITSLAALGLVYLGAVATAAVDSITAMTVVLNAFTGPWVVIVLIGFLRGRQHGYHPGDLQVFNERRRGGRYWFTGGWNLRAIVPFLLGSGFGLLAVDTRLYHGPLAQLGGGVDVSVAGSTLIAAVGYLIATRCWPERIAGPIPQPVLTSQGERA
jgi:purine-cytosine permease-like protein